MIDTKNIAIDKGKTFSMVVRWETDPIVYKTVSAVTSLAPLTLTVPQHDCKNGWRVVLTAFKGLTEVNAADANKPTDREFHCVTVVDGDTLELNHINAKSFKPYTSGGAVQYYTPTELTGFSARMAIKAKVQSANLLVCDVGGVAGDVQPTAAGIDGTVTWLAATSGSPAKEWTAGATYAHGDVIDLTDLLRLTTADGRIVIDAVDCTITLVISAADTARIDWKSGVYDLELVSPAVDPVVTALMRGKVTVTQEVTVP